MNFSEHHFNVINWLNSYQNLIPGKILPFEFMVYSRKYVYPINLILNRILAHIKESRCTECNSKMYEIRNMSCKYM